MKEEEGEDEKKSEPTEIFKVLCDFRDMAESLELWQTTDCAIDGYNLGSGLISYLGTKRVEEAHTRTLTPLKKTLSPLNRHEG